MANTKKKGGLGAESYFQNIPSLEPDEEEDAPSEATEATPAAVSQQNEEMDVAGAEQPATPTESPQEQIESGEEGDESTADQLETSEDDVVEESAADAQPDTAAIAENDVADETTEATVLVTAPQEASSPDGKSTESVTVEQPAEAPVTEFEARTSPVDDDDLAQAPDEHAISVTEEPVEKEEDDEEAEEPERVKIRRTYALYEETQIALEEMKLAARKQGIKTTLGDILEEAVLLLMEKKGMTPDM